MITKQQLFESIKELYNDRDICIKQVNDNPFLIEKTIDIRVNIIKNKCEIALLGLIENYGK